MRDPYGISVTMPIECMFHEKEESNLSSCKISARDHPSDASQGIPNSHLFAVINLKANWAMIQ